MSLNKIVLITICRAGIIANVALAIKVDVMWALIVNAIAAAMWWMVADGIGGQSESRSSRSKIG
jgi:hypothetical protein